jgi:hypothetical protein
MKKVNGKDRDHIVHIERGYMHCQGIAFTVSFDMHLTSAEGKKLECFKLTQNNIL